MIALRLLLRGRVQRVGLRRFCLDLAQELGISGRVRNLPDGSVELIVQGEVGKLREFVSSLEKAPKPIYIREIHREEIEVDPSIEYFSIEFGSLEEELQEGFGAMHSVFLEYWGEFREFSRRTDENFKLLGEKVEEVGRKVDSVGEEIAETREGLIGELRGSREDLRELLFKEVFEMKKEISEIKEILKREGMI